MDYTTGFDYTEGVNREDEKQIINSSLQLFALIIPSPALLT